MGLPAAPYSSRRRCLSPLSATDVLSNGHPCIVRPSSVRACARPANALAALRQLPRRPRSAVAGVPTSSGRTVGAVPPAVPDRASSHRAEAHSRGHCPSARVETSRPRTPLVAAIARGKPAVATTTKTPFTRSAPTPRLQRPGVPSTAGPERSSPRECVRPTSRASPRREPESPLPKLSTRRPPRLPEDDRDRFPSHADRVWFPNREVHARDRTPTRVAGRLLPTETIYEHATEDPSPRTAPRLLASHSRWPDSEEPDQPTRRSSGVVAPNGSATPRVASARSRDLPQPATRRAPHVTDSCLACLDWAARDDRAELGLQACTWNEPAWLTTLTRDSPFRAAVEVYARTSTSTPAPGMPSSNETPRDVAVPRSGPPRRLFTAASRADVLPPTTGLHL